MEIYFTAPQAAAQLGLSDRTVRNLCASDAMAAARTAGGHYRIAASEIERLKSLPAIPRATATSAAGNGAPAAVKKNAAHELLAAPSALVIAAAETAYVSDRELAADANRLQRLKLHREATELVDYFADRQQRELANEMEQERLEEQRHETEIQRRREQLAADERRRFESKWLTYALEQKPFHAPPDYALLVKPEAAAALAELEPDENDYVVQKVVEAAAARALAPWREAERRRQAAEYALETAVDSLPLWMRHDRDWSARARAAASEAIHGAHRDA